LITLLKRLKEAGSATAQMMVVGGMLIAGGTYVVSQQMSLKKLSVTANSKKQFGLIKREISESLIENTICNSTISRAGVLGTATSYDGIYGGDGTPLYTVGMELYGKVITSMRLLGYVTVTNPDPSTQDVVFAIGLRNADSAPKVIGGNTSVQKIPLKITTVNNEFVGCANDLSGLMLAALSTACTNLGGTYDVTSRNCLNLHGDSGMMMRLARENLCGEGADGSCRHPLEGQTCTGTDNRGQSWNNWVVSGYNPDGTLACLCVPAKCPDPATVCAGTDTGTDHCLQNCPPGTRTGASCTSCNAIAWAPSVDPATVCSDRELVERNSCGGERLVFGTMTCIR
jgi:hypothetical protein